MFKTDKERKLRFHSLTMFQIESQRDLIIKQQRLNER
jgi:hypothetical protein